MKRLLGKKLLTITKNGYANLYAFEFKGPDLDEFTADSSGNSMSIKIANETAKGGVIDTDFFIEYAMFKESV